MKASATGSRQPESPVSMIGVSAILSIIVAAGNLWAAPSASSPPPLKAGVPGSGAKVLQAVAANQGRIEGDLDEALVLKVLKEAEEFAAPRSAAGGSPATAAMLRGSSTRIYQGPWSWPVRKGWEIITGVFGEWRGDHRHAGIDIGASTGTRARAAAPGRVIYSGWLGGYGKAVILRHDSQLTTLYAHNSSLSVRVGQWVARGQTVSRVGNTGHSFGPHLHFEVRRRGVAINPRPQLRK